MIKKAIKFTSLFLAVSLAAGCAARLVQRPWILKGTFRGETSDGRPVAMTLSEKNSAFNGQGVLKGKKISLTGLVLGQGIGTLVDEDGQIEIVSWTLSPGGEDLILLGLEEPIRLSRGGSPVRIIRGPLSGFYELQGDQNSWVWAQVNQNGNVLYGTANILGDNAALAGRLLSPDSGEGLLLYSDKSERRFRIKISEGRKTIVIMGMGKPLIFKKK